MRKIFFMLFTMFFVAPVYAADYMADTCSYADVSAKVALADDGDTVHIPAGNCTWNTTLVVTENITLWGAGTGQTNITDSAPVAWNGAAIRASVSGVFRITGISFIGSASRTKGVLWIYGSTNSFRVDHCDFTGNVRYIFIGNNGGGYGTYGLIDNCTFTLTTDNKIQAIHGWGGTSGDWHSPYTWGSADAIYIEDCVFDFQQKGDSVYDGEMGARTVIRYNYIYGDNVGCHGPDSVPSSQQAMEIYENTFVKGNNDSTRAIHHRGGGILVYNNTFEDYTLSNGEILLNYFRSCGGFLDGRFTGRPCDGDDPLDDNTNSTGWVCYQQTGAAYGGDPNDTATDPAYEWNNKLGNGTDVDFTLACSTNMQENRDYYNDTQKSGYTAYIYPHPLRSGEVESLSPAPPGDLSGMLLQ